ncbi:MAG: 6-hydroxymethylpterin diphosphokinase MptE-like protein [Candidatus Natronoplasma sp.]
MKFADWEPLYREIRDDFGYSEEEDTKAAEFLVDVRGSDGLRPLRALKGEVIEICGPYFSEVKGGVKIAAGASLEQMLEKGVEPDLMVTDLDGDTALQSEMNSKGIPAVMHAHGDNIDLINGWAKRFEGHVISTCQCKPPKKGIYNFGGFTDGDRAAFIADHFDAEEIILSGWDLEKPYDKREIKKKKLQWAKRLLKRIEIPISPRL